jgi:hypothetical protein
MSENYVTAVLKNRLPKEFLPGAEQTISAVIADATREWSPLNFEGEYPLSGIGIAILTDLDYGNGRTPEEAYIVVLGFEGNDEDYMVQFDVNGQTLPWTSVGAKVVPMKPIAAASA